MQECGALGRVILRCRYKRVYAEMRWQINKKECSQFLCPVAADNRAANLATAWQYAHDHGLTMPSNSETAENAET
jgi:hypothetical protein